MTSRLIVHIGLPKTGSTAVQAFLAENCEHLDEAGYGWLPGSRGANFSELAVAFSTVDNPTTRRYLRRDQDRRRWRDRIARRLVRARDDHPQVIISSEHLAAQLRTPAETRALADFLQPLVDEVMIIGVVRRADYWLPSDYAEAIRSGRDIKQGPGFVQRRSHLLDHDSLIGRWTGAFGTGNVRLLPFLEADKSDPAAAPIRCLEAAGLPQAVTTSWNRPAQLSRVGLSAEAAETLRRINPQLGLGSWHTGADRARLVALLADRHPGRGVALTPAAHSALDRHGWIQTGIELATVAHGDRWTEWVAEPAAPIRRPVQLDAPAVDATLEVVRAAGFGDPHPISRRLRRGLQRLRH